MVGVLSGRQRYVVPRDVATMMRVTSAYLLTYPQG